MMNMIWGCKYLITVCDINSFFLCVNICVYIWSKFVVNSFCLLKSIDLSCFSYIDIYTKISWLYYFYIVNIYLCLHFLQNTSILYVTGIFESQSRDLWLQHSGLALVQFKTFTNICFSLFTFIIIVFFALDAFFSKFQYQNSWAIQTVWLVTWLVLVNFNLLFILIYILSQIYLSKTDFFTFWRILSNASILPSTIQTIDFSIRNFCLQAQSRFQI